MPEVAVKTCRCGLKMVAQANGIWTCGHCDLPCSRKGPVLGCPRCAAQLRREVA